MPDRRSGVRLDVVALVVAGVVDLVAGVDAALVLSDGSVTSSGKDAAARAEWVATHSGRWQAGWSYWFIVTTTFAWGFYALGRRLGGTPQWRSLAVGAALLAAAVDVVGIVINIAVLPDLARELQHLRGAARDAVLVHYSAAETLAQALTDITAFGLYTVAGLLLLPAVFATHGYPRGLAWVAVVLWGVSALTTALLAAAAAGAAATFAIALLLYPVWVWGSAQWLRRQAAVDVPRAAA